MIAVICIAMVPAGYFGWKGVISSICLAIAGFLLLFGNRALAALLLVLLVVGQTLYPAVDGSILRTECSNNLRQLALAIISYETVHGHLPPAFSTDADGRALHSWRVLLLPYLGETELYAKIDLAKPWDDPVNVRLHDQMPDVFCCPEVKYHSRWKSKGNTTAYVVVVDDTTAWRVHSPPKLSQIVDGLSRTIAIVESEKHRIHWMCPKTPNLESFLAEVEFGHHHLLTPVARFDGSSDLLHNELTPEQLRARLTIDARDDQ